MNLPILLPFEDAFLECTIATRVFLHADIRKIRDIRDIIAIKDFSFCNQNMDAEKKRKNPNWWNQVEAMTKPFSWVEFRRDLLPTVKTYAGTLEFQDGCHRAIALAFAALADPTLKVSVPVLLQC